MPRAGLKNGFLLQSFPTLTALRPRSKTFSAALKAASERFLPASLRRKYWKIFRNETVFETCSSRLSLGLLAVFMTTCAAVKTVQEAPVEAEAPIVEVPADPKRESITLVIAGHGVASFATVGIFKRLHEERVPVARVIAMGWPALFAGVYSGLRSIHDLEWFAMRISENQLFQGRGFIHKNKIFSESRCLSLLEKKMQTSRPPRFPLEILGTSLPDGNLPSLIVSTMKESAALFDEPHASESESRELNWPKSFTRESSKLIVVSIYNDALREVSKESPDKTRMLQAEIRLWMDSADGTLSIESGKLPYDLTQRRAAIQQGYRKTKELLETLRAHQSGGAS